MSKMKISVKFSPGNKKDAGNLLPAGQERNLSPHRKSRPADISADAPSEKCSVMAFRIHDRWFALKQRLIHRVASFAMPRVLPEKTNDILRGLVYAAGDCYLCFSFQGLLKVKIPDESPAGKNIRSRLLIVGEQDRWAFSVEEMMAATVSVSQNQGRKKSITTELGDMDVLHSFDWQGEKVELLDEGTLFTVLSRSLVV
jgi:chemotaxis signal transduction protein